jgi:hypothetical protein
MPVLRNPYGAGDNGPSPLYRAVTPSDTVYFPAGPARALLVKTAGDATIVGLDDVPVTVYLVQGYNPLICQRVNSTGLTAAGITALY